MRRTLTPMVSIAFFFGIFYVFGLSVLAYGTWAAWRSMQAANWPTTTGTINQLAIKEVKDSEGGSRYDVEVKYTYAVGGIAFEGSRIAFGFGSSRREAAGDIYRKLKTANSVLVRYAPSDHALSCLSFGIHRNIATTLLFSICWLAFFFGFSLMFWLSSTAPDVILKNLSVQ